MDYKRRSKRSGGVNQSEVEVDLSQVILIDPIHCEITVYGSSPSELRGCCLDYNCTYSKCDRPDADLRVALEIERGFLKDKLRYTITYSRDSIEVPTELPVNHLFRNNFDKDVIPDKLVSRFQDVFNLVPRTPVKLVPRLQDEMQEETPVKLVPRLQDVMQDVTPVKLVPRLQDVTKGLDEKIQTTKKGYRSTVHSLRIQYEKEKVEKRREEERKRISPNSDIMVGSHVLKQFPLSDEFHKGKIIGLKRHWYTVKYEDGDCEDMTRKQVIKYLKK
jgi:hypothetical protein